MMEETLNATGFTSAPNTTQNDTLTTETVKHTPQNWEFLVAVIVSAISISILIGILAKCQVIRRYLASYRHTRLRETDTVSQCEPSGLGMAFSTREARENNPQSLPPVPEEDDDGFIEDNYIPTSERMRAERAVEHMEDTDDTEDEMDEIVFTIA